MQPDSNILLSVNSLTVEFQSGPQTNTAVDGISFEVKKGEVLGIVGESGSGKSITALSINQLIRSIPNAHQDGAILFQNGEVENLTEATERSLQGIRGRSISMIFQEPMTSLNPVMKCGRQIEEVLEIHQNYDKRERKEQVLELLRQVMIRDVERIYNAYPSEISGGQKQRVMIAMAMACEPQLLIADEPTTALDVTIQRTIIDLMRDLQQRTGMSIIFISHDLNLVAEIADRILVMRNGQIIEQGEVVNIFQKTREPYTLGLLASRPPLDMRLHRLPLMEDFEKEDTRTPLKQLWQGLEEKKPSRVAEKRPAILEVEDLKVWFSLRKNWLDFRPEHVKAVNGVSFSMQKGEILGLVGESGSGKTTLGRALVRLVEPTSGKVLFDQQEVLQMDRQRLKKLRRRIQIIFQDPYASLNPRMSIGQAIMEPLWVHGHIRNKKEGEQEVKQLLEKVGLEHTYFNRFPNEFSGGQRQRIGIARALAARPDMLICDESVASLDVSIQAQILNLLKDLRDQENLSILFISHDLAVIKFLSERILVMKDGLVVEEGTSEEIYKNAKQPYTQKLIQAIPKSPY
jgi:peptide/nickel transport system ATP-binding protein